jgi:hypothetical protein
MPFSFLIQAVFPVWNSKECLKYLLVMLLKKIRNDPSELCVLYHFCLYILACHLTIWGLLFESNASTFMLLSIYFNMKSTQFIIWTIMIDLLSTFYQQTFRLIYSSWFVLFSAPSVLFFFIFFLTSMFKLEHYCVVCKRWGYWMKVDREANVKGWPNLSYL